MQPTVLSMAGRTCLWTGFIIGAVAAVAWLDSGWQHPKTKHARPTKVDDQQLRASDFTSAGVEVAASIAETNRSWPIWSTIPWGTYSLGLLLGIVGGVMIHCSKRQTDRARLDNADGLPQVRQRLGELVERLENLNAGLDAMKPQQILDFIEQHCQESFDSFAHHRLALADHFGLTAYAQVMSEVASAERFTNRAWSAAADGYIDEVQASIQRALAHITLAAQLFGEIDQR
ncbi:MAG TPA: hypothetical protein PKD54_02480 [Pirellulaceae bacterium]|mgnify:CR=1 FL=1|nr:hypothetical protein [Pirellulaceae bacterium]